MVKKCNITFQVEDTTYQAVLKKVRGAKMIRITLSQGAPVTVTGPFFVPFLALEKFLVSKKAWIAKELSALEALPTKRIALSRAAFLAKKEGARALVLKKLQHWNKQYGFMWNRVSIRNQKTRFGSCSAQGNLSFHASIIDFPEELQDYLIVHELCHLQEMNHGPKFWTLVSQAIPDARLRAKELANWHKE
jgi:predicted metal-dependent hydrolase